MAYRAFYRWLGIGLLLLLLAGIAFFVLRNLSTPPTQQVIKPRAPLAPTPGVSTPALRPTPTPSPTAVAPHLTQISRDPYSNGTSQHETEVEPASFAYNTTIVAAFQAGRFVDVGSSNIGWATSVDGGTHWQQGFLPDTTLFVGGPYGRITDPSVAYNAAYRTWMISAIAFLNAPDIYASVALVSLSTNGGTAWSRPVIVTNVGTLGGVDKDWLACDNTVSSRFYGNCYLVWDNYHENDLLQMSTSSDGGRTWGNTYTTVTQDTGFSAYPLIQPNGTVIVPISNPGQTALKVFTSTDGGARWSTPNTIITFPSHARLDRFANSILFTDGMDSSGTLYLIWLDCRFEPNCSSNDLLMMTSPNGRTWSPIRRIPISQIGAGVTYSVLGLGVDPQTSGSVAHLGLAFYSYAANCLSSCDLTVDFISSSNGGTTWSHITHLGNSFPYEWAAAGSNTVGDYITVSFSGGRAFPIFAQATTPSNGQLHEAMFTMANGLSTGTAATG
jgi:hypothetical protein